MSKTVLLDELHLSFRIPATLPDATARTIRRLLLGRAFTAELKRAVGAVIRARPELAEVRVALAR